MGKRKYIKVPKLLSYTNVSSKCNKTTRLKVANCSVPALVPYYKLSKFLDDINIGTLHSVSELCQDASDDKPDGLFRDIKEFVPRLAQF